MRETKDSSPADCGNNNHTPCEITVKDKTQTKSRKRKWLVAMTILFFVSTAVFTALFVYYYRMPDNAPGVAPTTTEICNTPNCVITASIMANKMNFTSNPCDDFSEFACGRFFKEAKLKEGVYQLSTFTYMTDANKEILTEFITDKIGPADPQYLKKIKTFYKSCLDLGAIEKVGVGSILNNTNLINNWPTLNPAWNERHFDSNDILARCRSLLVNPLFQYDRYWNYEEISKNELQINPPPLDLDWPVFLQPGPQPRALRTYLTELAIALGAAANVSSQDANDVVNFQRKQAEIFAIMNASPNGGGIKSTTLSKVGDICPNIDVAGMMRSDFGVAGFTLPDDLKLKLIPGEYLILLNKLVNQTSPRTLMNVFAFRYAMDQMNDGSQYLRDIRAKFNKVINPSYTDPPRQETCLQVTASVFKTGLSKLYLDKTFTDEAKNYVEKMFVDLKTVFKRMLEDSTWMSTTTKEEAIRKLESMGADIGYPDSYDEYDNYFDIFYENCTITEDRFYDNLIQIMKFRHIQAMRIYLSVAVNERDVSLTNAYYKDFSNAIEVFAGILQPPVFSLIFPDYYNYAAVGSTIGHEMTHGFDKSGTLLNSDGFPSDWWGDDDKAEYFNKIQCFADQYSGFYLEEVNMTINGNQTVEESLGDAVGLKVSFRAFKEEEKRTGKQLTLPGLDLTQDQLFFLSYAQVWCAQQAPVLVRYLLYRDVHPTGKFRLIGPLQNSEDFAKAYNCPRGSYMNPNKKCSMW